jgi:hypothetical protein
LARDTGVLLTAGYCIWLLTRKELRRTLLFATAIIPAALWYLFLSTKTAPYSADGALAVPFTGFLDRLIHPMQYPLPRLVVAFVSSADYLALAGILLAFILVVPVARKARFSPAAWALILFAALGVLLWRPGDWLEFLDYGRILSPLLVLMALEFFETKSRLVLLPVLMVLPRFGLMFGRQIFGVAKGMSGLIG